MDEDLRAGESAMTDKNLEEGKEMYPNLLKKEIEREREERWSKGEKEEVASLETLIFLEILGKSISREAQQRAIATLGWDGFWFTEVFLRKTFAYDLGTTFDQRVDRVYSFAERDQALRGSLSNFFLNGKDYKEPPPIRSFSPLRVADALQIVDTAIKLQAPIQYQQWSSTGPIEDRFLTTAVALCYHYGTQASVKEIPKDALAIGIPKDSKGLRTDALLESEKANMPYDLQWSDQCLYVDISPEKFAEAIMAASQRIKEKEKSHETGLFAKVAGRSRTRQYETGDFSILDGFASAEAALAALPWPWDYKQAGILTEEAIAATDTPLLLNLIALYYNYYYESDKSEIECMAELDERTADLRKYLKGDPSRLGDLAPLLDVRQDSGRDAKTFDDHHKRVSEYLCRVNYDIALLSELWKPDIPSPRTIRYVLQNFSLKNPDDILEAASAIQLPSNNNEKPGASLCDLYSIPTKSAKEFLTLRTRYERASEKFKKATRYKEGVSWSLPVRALTNLEEALEQRNGAWPAEDGYLGCFIKNESGRTQRRGERGSWYSVESLTKAMALADRAGNVLQYDRFSELVEQEESNDGRFVIATLVAYGAVRNKTELDRLEKESSAGLVASMLEDLQPRRTTLDIALLLENVRYQKEVKKALLEYCNVLDDDGLAAFGENVRAYRATGFFTDDEKGRHSSLPYTVLPLLDRSDINANDLTLFVNSCGCLDKYWTDTKGKTCFDLAKFITDLRQVITPACD